MLKTAALLAAGLRRQARGAAEPALCFGAAPAFRQVLSVSACSWKDAEIAAAFSIGSRDRPPPQSAAEPAQSDAPSKTFTEGYIAMHKGMQAGGSDYVGLPRSHCQASCCLACR
jgi:hypothetical protein